jgi:hypothetical protein
LSVTAKPGKALVKCHKGCPNEDIMAALGLPMSALFDDPDEGANGKREIVATYDYTDEAGQLLFQVARFVPKDFRQRRPDGRGGWIWSTKGVRKVLYRLPEVLAAVAAGDPVFIVEGEKDATALVRAGHTATCNPMGVGKWRAEHTRALEGAKQVVVVADKDVPGWRHARSVRDQVAGVAGEVVVVEALSGKDVSDHLAAGLSVEQLVVLDDASLEERCQDGALSAEAATAKAGRQPNAEGRSVRLTRASVIRPRAVRWTWEDRLAVGTFNLLGGREGIGKSTIGLALAAQLTRGTMPGIHFGKPKAVIVATTEDAWEFTIVPRLMAAGADLDLVYRADVTEAEVDGLPLVLPSDLGGLEERAREVGAAAIMLDPVISRLDESLDSAACTAAILTVFIVSSRLFPS